MTLVHLLDCNEEDCNCELLELQEKLIIKDFLHYSWIEQGLKFGFPLCCVFFFSNVWNNNFKSKIGNENNWGWSTGEGRVYCPDCIARRIEIGDR